VSGSRINEQKKEILKIGNPDTINHPYIHQLVKDKVKVLGIWFGKDHKNTNWLQIQNKVKIQFEKGKKSKHFQFANFGKYPILSPDLAM
jgi:hypothetical protein